MYYRILFTPLRFLVVVHTLGTIILLGKFLISQELRVHTLGVDVLGLLGLFNTITVSLVGVVMGTCILLLCIAEKKWRLMGM